MAAASLNLAAAVTAPGGECTGAGNRKPKTGWVPKTRVDFANPGADRSAS